MKVIAIIQARMASTRLPGKVLLPICGTTVVEMVAGRVSLAQSVDLVVVATTSKHEDDELVSKLESGAVNYFRGSEDNVLQRYLECAKHYDADAVVRITADCPFVDPSIIDSLVQKVIVDNYDYASNTLKPTYPDGLDVEVFKTAALEVASNNATDIYDLEHVSPFIKRSNLFKKFSLEQSIDYSHFRWTLDEPDDYEFLIAVTNTASMSDPNIIFPISDIYDCLQSHPELLQLNSGIARNEGAEMSKGQKLWKRAKRVIPGGNMLLSKRSEMFLPTIWPSYFESAAGVNVTDLEGITYTDFSIMGIGTNTLGYGHPDVDAAVSTAVKKGNMSSLNCPEEVYFLEKLISLHPWADMGRLTRSGGEANAVAVRIARAASGRDGVAVCGYHGWHDWYLSVNHSGKDDLREHLLPGLSPKGVPTKLKGSTFPFHYNDLNSLKDIIASESIGVIKMEVRRDAEPDPEFLKGVREIATKHGVVLIFDECTSGFRETFGGLHLKYGIQPDMAVFGKAIGNGYALNAIIGREEVMQAAQQTFISSTFWTERIGPSAGLATLNAMEKTKSWELISEIGQNMKSIWLKTANTAGISITIGGLDALASFVFAGELHLEFKTYLTQEMLKNKLLASNLFYAATPHSASCMGKYEDILGTVFSNISRFQSDGTPAIEFLDGPVCHAGFTRLT